jgi:hypothetical protein
MGPRRGWLVVVALVVPGSGCGVAHPQELNYRTDKRLHFLSPKPRTLVQTPVDVRWSIREFKIRPLGSAPPSQDAGYFAVFVDRAPIKPDESMRVIASKDQVCLHRPGCPDETYLNDRRIFTTTEMGMAVEQIPPLPGDKERVQLHAVTVILMDTSGHRIGESAWQLDLRLRKLGL